MNVNDIKHLVEANAQKDENGAIVRRGNNAFPILAESGIGNMIGRLIAPDTNVKKKADDIYSVLEQKFNSIDSGNEDAILTEEFYNHIRKKYAILKDGKFEFLTNARIQEIIEKGLKGQEISLIPIEGKSPCVAQTGKTISEVLSEYDTFSYLLYCQLASKKKVDTPAFWKFLEEKHKEIQLARKTRQDYESAALQKLHNFEEDPQNPNNTELNDIIESEKLKKAKEGEAAKKGGVTEMNDAQESARNKYHPFNKFARFTDKISHNLKDKWYYNALSFLSLGLIKPNFKNKFVNKVASILFPIIGTAILGALVAVLFPAPFVLIPALYGLAFGIGRFMKMVGTDVNKDLTPGAVKLIDDFGVGHKPSKSVLPPSIKIPPSIKTPTPEFTKANANNVSGLTPKKPETKASSDVPNVDLNKLKTSGEVKSKITPAPTEQPKNNELELDYLTFNGKHYLISNNSIPRSVDFVIENKCYYALEVKEGGKEIVFSHHHNESFAPKPLKEGAFKSQVEAALAKLSDVSISM